MPKYIDKWNIFTIWAEPFIWILFISFFKNQLSPLNSGWLDYLLSFWVNRAVSFSYLLSYSFYGSLLFPRVRGVRMTTPRRAFSWAGACVYMCALWSCFVSEVARGQRLQKQQQQLHAAFTGKRRGVRAHKRRRAAAFASRRFGPFNGGRPRRIALPALVDSLDAGKPLEVCPRLVLTQLSRLCQGKLVLWAPAWSAHHSRLATMCASENVGFSWFMVKTPPILSGSALLCPTLNAASTRA